MKVSVIVPSYNHASYVAETLESIAQQDYDDFEVIVIDDGSKDGSPEILKNICKEYGFNLVVKENEGICRTFNHGIFLATGEFITFLASDDRMPPNRLREQVQAMIDNPTYDVISGGVRMIDVRGNYLRIKLPVITGDVSYEDMLRRNSIIAPTAIFRRDVFSKHGMYDPDQLIEDYSMWLKLLRNGGRILNTDNIWADYRVAETNLEKRFRWYYQGNIRALTPYLADDKVKASLKRFDLVFAAKMTLLNGHTFFKSDPGFLNKLQWHHRCILNITAHVPTKIRHLILNYLLVNY